MNPEVKALWLTALRSGEYVQTGGGLKIVISSLTENPVRYCCLGVLCDLAVKAGAVEETPGRIFSEGGSSQFHGFGKERLTATLPDEVTEWSGLETSVGWLKRDIDGRFDLTDLNDSGHTFQEIADIIEEQF